MNNNTSKHYGSASKSKYCNRLPLIPLSPLTQTSIEYAKALAQTTKSLSETTTTGGDSHNTSNIISLLNKDLFKERAKLDGLTKDIQNIQSQFLADLNNYEIAKEIAYIDCSLFRLFVLDKKWISNFDKQSNIVPLLDFHRYLSHSFAHQIIFSAEEEEPEDTGNHNKRKSLLLSGDNNNNNKSNVISQLIQIAYILMHIYRDFSGCSAILTSLQMPEVQRLERLWSQCPSKLLSIYKEFVSILSPQNNYEAYHQHLWLHTTRFLNTSPLKSQMIAVPFMHAHLTMIRNLIHTHSVVALSNNNNKQNNNFVVLSDAGKKSFISAIHVLEFCQQHSKIDSLELERNLSTQSNKINGASRSNSMISGVLKLSVAPCSELDKLHSNPNLYHWIVSRAYLTRSQLHHESLQVKPLTIGEVELETEEEYDLYWDFFRQPIVVESSKQSSSTVDSQQVVVVLEQQKVLKQQHSEEEQQDISAIDHHQNTVDDLVIVAPYSATTKAENTPSDAADVAQSSTPVVDINSNNDLLKEGGNNTEIIIAYDDIEEYVDKEQSISIEEDDNETDIIIVEEEEEQVNKIAVLNKEVVENHAIFDSKPEDRVHKKDDDSLYQEECTPVVSESITETTTAAAPVVIKPVLSPTAPEFIPQQQQYIPSEDESQITIDEEDDEEEWTGYPLDNSVSQMEEEEEEWTGYPIASPDEEDEEEVWKGYPVPQNSLRTIELSSPSIPQEEQPTNKNHFSSNEEWKGYQKTSEEEQRTAKNNNNKDYPISWDNHHNKNNQLNAIGKAAARKMQYSLSNTDNRKKLPSFTPSAST